MQEFPHFIGEFQKIKNKDFPQMAQEIESSYQYFKDYFKNYTSKDSFLKDKTPISILNLDGLINQKINQEIYFNQNVAYAMEDLVHYGSLVRVKKEEYYEAIGKVKEYLDQIQIFSNS